MNGVCTHVVRLNVHSKKLDYYTGNYDAYVAERRVRDEDQQRKYDAEQRDIAEIKDFIARFGHGTVKMVRQAQSREKLLEKKLEAGLTPKPQADAAWDFTFPDPGELPTPVLMIQVRAPPFSPWTRLAPIPTLPRAAPVFLLLHARRPSPPFMQGRHVRVPGLRALVPPPRPRHRPRLAHRARRPERRGQDDVRQAHDG